MTKAKKYCCLVVSDGMNAPQALKLQRDVPATPEINFPELAATPENLNLILTVALELNKALKS